MVNRLVRKCSAKYADIRGEINLGDRRNNSMYELYGEYGKTLKNANKTLRKRQKINRGIREKYKEPFKREDHQANVNDITNWNSMIRDLEEDMKLMEMYLDFDDRILLHRDYNNMKSMILNQNSYEGEVPFETLYDECVDGVEDIICNVEFQEEIIDLLDKVLTERQEQVINLYYFKGMTQEKIARELSIDRTTVTKMIQRSLEILRKSEEIGQIIEK